MSFNSLGDFVALLEKKGQLKRINAKVDPELEITEITDRVSKGPLGQNVALLFENVQDSDFPVLVNSMGHPQRMAWALGVDDLDQLGDKLSKLLDFELPQGVGPTINRAGSLLDALRSVGLRPSVVRKAPVQEEIHIGDDIDLSSLPILKCWPEDGGRYITLPTVITRDPINNSRNVGMYRLQVQGPRTLGMHWQIHKGGADHWRASRDAGIKQIPVAVSLGGDPVIMWSGSAPLPPGIDEFLLAGWVRGKPVELVSCVTQPLEAPANAEIVIEGYVDPSELAPEGPFGDHTGHYTPVEDYPVMHVTAITHRHTPTYPTTVVGIPPMEDYWMGKATERLFLPLMKLFMGEIVDVSMPMESVFHNLVLVSIHKQYPGHARKVINGLWGLGLMSLSKCIIVFDAAVDVQDTRTALFHAFNNTDWAHDVIIQEGPTDALDHASYHAAFGGKIGIDATHKWQDEGYSRQWPKLIEMTPEIKTRIDDLWQELGL